MREQLVSVKIARLAKEKGFNHKCKTAYLSNTVGLYHSEFYLNYDINGCVVPTQSLLQKWLRETHSIYAEARVLCDIDNDKMFHSPFVNNRIVLHDNRLNKYSTYEQALSTALIKSLELINH